MVRTHDKQDVHENIMTCDKIMIAETRERCTIVGVHDNQVGHESIMTNGVTMIAARFMTIIFVPFIIIVHLIRKDA
jgi:hypothetical protein